MWKVLIADDEPKIRRGLRATIEARCPDTTVVGEAEDGELALAAVRSEKPDIALVDINMPLLNGLDLIEKIHAETGDCAIIVVTGHDEFDYAKKALQLRVFDYLLKPVDQEHLAEVMRKAQADLTATRRRDRYLEWAREQLERNMPVLRDQFGRDWIGGGLDALELKEQARFFSIELDHRAGVILVHVLERFAPAETGSTRERHLLHFAVRAIVEEAVAPLGPVLVFLDNFDNVVAITSIFGGEEWLTAAERIRSRATRSIVQAIRVEQMAAPDGADSVPDAYDALLARVNDQGNSASIVIKTQTILEADYARSDIGLDEVAGRLHLSPGYLSRVLKQQTGYSFIDYLARIRINRAMQLLNDPSMKLYEVAEMVGFASQHYFSRAFKRVLGIPPIEYRKGGVR
ncbi:response regulator [Salinispira pacifica]